MLCTNARISTHKISRNLPRFGVWLAGDLNYYILLFFLLLVYTKYPHSGWCGSIVTVKINLALVGTETNLEHNHPTTQTVKALPDNQWNLFLICNLPPPICPPIPLSWAIPWIFRFFHLHNCKFPLNVHFFLIIISKFTTLHIHRLLIWVYSSLSFSLQIINISKQAQATFMKIHILYCSIKLPRKNPETCKETKICLIFENSDTVTVVRNRGAI